MDHANAHLIEFNPEETENQTTTSKAASGDGQQSVGKNENISHNREQHQQSDYYKKLGEDIRNYSEVLLFGPTNAKTELFNTLKSDHRFEKIKIDIKQADKMSENQQHAFVKDHFTNK